MASRIPGAVMVLLFALFTIIGIHDLLNDIGVTAVTSERTHTGDPFFIVLDVLCAIAPMVGIAMFTSLLLAGKNSSTSRGPFRRWEGELNSSNRLSAAKK
jgi:hypothetical protein